tara:strand:- start:1314 stop:2054 length:741 start_codon:yes stop_codon:yes gene_type:complete
MSSKTVSSPSVDDQEVEKFSQLAQSWWDQEGPFKPLHIFNPTRITYIKDMVAKHLHKPFSELDIVDIGCGGGLLAEPMARLGAHVTAIDASEKNIGVANLHAKQSKLDIDYQCTTAENLAKQAKQFDVVLNMEVIEHVADVNSFVEASMSLVKPGGLLFTATLNRTVKSYMFAIVGAEYVLRWLPRGTHQWSKFLKPSEVESMIYKHGGRLVELEGMSFNPLTSKWSLSRDLDVNYVMVSMAGQRL